MQQLKYIVFLFMSALLATSCSKQIAEKQANPNNPSSVTPNLILGTVLTYMSGTHGSGNTGSLGGVNSWDVVHGWNQYHCQNYNYYGNNIYSWTDGSTTSENGIGNISSGPFNSYIVLKNVVQMEQEV